MIVICAKRNANFLKREWSVKQVDREKIIRIIDELIFEAQKEPTWKAENALRCVKKELLKKQEAVVHPEPSCEMTYITDCCCDLCGVQLIREDNFCRCCGKPIVWEGR